MLNRWKIGAKSILEKVMQKVRTSMKNIKNGSQNQSKIGWSGFPGPNLVKRRDHFWQPFSGIDLWMHFGRTLAPF